MRSMFMGPSPAVSDQPRFQSVCLLREMFEIRLELGANQFAGGFERERVSVRHQNRGADEVVGCAAEPPENKPRLCRGILWPGNVAANRIMRSVRAACSACPCVRLAIIRRTCVQEA